MRSMLVCAVLSASAAIAMAKDLDRYYQPNQCGPIALYAVCHLYGIHATIHELGDLAGLDRRGTSMAGLVSAAKAKGLSASAYHSSVRHLQRLAGPVILDCPEGHFCVLLGWDDGRAVLFDPLDGQRLLTTDELAAEWQGHVIVFQEEDNTEQGRR